MYKRYDKMVLLTTIEMSEKSYLTNTYSEKKPVGAFPMVLYQIKIRILIYIYNINIYYKISYI